MPLRGTVRRWRSRNCGAYQNRETPDWQEFCASLLRRLESSSDEHSRVTDRALPKRIMWGLNAAAAEAAEDAAALARPTHRSTTESALSASTSFRG